MKATLFRRMRGPTVASTILMIAALSGCGGGTGEVSGKVTVNGTPVKGGSVIFFCKGGKPGETVHSEIREDGTYRILDCPAGLVVATVRPHAAAAGSPKPKKDAAEAHTKSAMLDQGRAHAAESNKGAKAPSIPSRYADPDASDLKYTVTRGTQTFDIELKP